MIKIIIQMLEMANGETENIRIAQGKYLFPKTFGGVLKGFKKELEWRKK
tara:strand:+ start:358 stop:504 length:147 start_codon:yes stop_codon:yes gene_type:complete